MEEYVSSLRGVLALALNNIAVQDEGSEAEAITFVLGNESCDLDSAVSAVVLAYFLNGRGRCRLAVPLLNVPCADVPLKTEVEFCLGRCKMSVGDVPCREEIRFEALPKFELVLVDHHEPFSEEAAQRVVEIIDHRPMAVEPPKSAAKVRVEPVGSCATLVMKRIWEEEPGFDDEAALRLVRYAVVADTVNFSAQAKKATPEDAEVVDRIDRMLRLDRDSRKVDLRAVLRAKSDLGRLTVKQCLRRDLKIVPCQGGLGVAMSSLMRSCRVLASRPGFEGEASSFLEANGCQALVVMGVEVSMTDDDTMERDLAVFPNDSASISSLAAELIRKLPERSELRLEAEVSSTSTMLFKQGDPSFSRKQVLPMVKEICGSISS